MKALLQRNHQYCNNIHLNNDGGIYDFINYKSEMVYACSAI